MTYIEGPVEAERQSAKRRANRAPRVPERIPAGRSGELVAQQRGSDRAVVAALRRSAGLSTVIQRDAKEKIEKPTGKTNEDFDNTQYRLTGDNTSRKIELVVRRTRKNGAPYYEATGEVTGWQKKMPIVKRYDKPKDLGDWAPRVTHVNGMMVTPESGMTSANTLLDSVQGKIAAAGNDVAVDQDAIDVLYTYSAKQGLVADLWDCLKGKLRVRDDVTRSQEQLMLDAVAAKRRIHVSAHSRGTIKTDNAVRTVFKTLTAQYTQELLAKPDKALQKEAQAFAKELEATGLFDSGMAADFSLQQAAEQKAKERAKKDMDRYIQLVYAGNAVSYPSSVIPVTMLVGSKDPISFGVGTYTKSGAKWASGNKRSNLTKVPGATHGYTQNYAKPVGGKIGLDVLQD